MTTTFLPPAAPTDTLRLHDVYRITFNAPRGWWRTTAEDSDEFGEGLSWLFSGGTRAFVPLHANPYQPGDLSVTADFFYASSLPMNVSDALNALREAASDQVEIAAVQKIVGAGAIAPGTSAAENAVYGVQGADDRYRDQAAAQTAAEAQAGIWGGLSDSIQTAGKYAIGLGVVAALFVYAPEIKGALTPVVRRLRG